MDENKTNIPAEATEKVPVAGKFWLSFADCLCGTLNSLLTGGGMTYFFTKFMGMDEKLASLKTQNTGNYKYPVDDIMINSVKISTYSSKDTKTVKK